jgi:trans-2,3-dihydro-3-hydroxyanthranilate isomerase
MSDTLSFVTADVFTTRAYGGNPLAVVLNGAHLSTAQMKAVAREFNLSETTFILPPTTAGSAAHVRIFTPNTELPFAGHPTVGTAWVMATLGLIKAQNGIANTVFDEGVGRIPVVVAFDGQVPSYATFTTAMVPEVLAPPPPSDVLLRMVGLDAGDQTSGTPAMTLSCGTPYTCIPVRDSAAVAKSSLNSDVWKTHLATTSAHKVYVFARPSPGIVHARMYAPGEGVAEDPATGSAACAVTGWLVRDDGLQDGTGRWTIHQGAEVGRPSEIKIEADVQGGRIVAVRCGGQAVVMAQGTVQSPVPVGA